METEICHNCKREVPQQNYLMHVAHCARNMAVCPVCGIAVPKAHLKDHRYKEHALVECPACRHKVQASAMESHRTSSCGRRTVACEFCELELPKDDLIEHELYCGARTERCDECGELVMHKYRKLHLDSNHGFLKLNDEPGPTATWQTVKSNQSKQKEHKSTDRINNGPLNTMRSINNVLPSTTSVNNNVEAASACAVPLKSKKLDEENGFITGDPESEPPLRDTPRTYVPAYDASEDLRAKVKLARHDLNNIKNTYLLQGDERIRQLQQHSEQQSRGPDLLATNRQSRTRFTTNLVPYEKNKSFKVNALPDDERAVVLGTIPQPLAPLRNVATTPVKPNNNNNSGGGYFNYLGGREESVVPVVPLSKLTNNMSNNGNSGVGGSSTGAVPRTTRKKGPAPPIPSNANKQKLDGDCTEDVTLPCEFCGKMIRASFLVQHETACRPDLAQLKIANSTDIPTSASVDVVPATVATTTTEVQLPCEFCCNLYPMSQLLSHQALCDV